MNLKLLSILAVSLHILAIGYSQTVLLKGHVTDKHGDSLFAVNVYLLKQSTVGTITDLNGNFILTLDKSNVLKNDSLVLSFIGYYPEKISFSSVDFSKPLHIILKENSQTLNEVVVEARKSITKEFSIKELDRMKIYLSPLSSGDALKAIMALPSSTNTNETANPELRGSQANRTAVFLNGVPVSNPVRNSQITGIGFFSLFNTELIKSELVYPSNPPLIYGNSSAGIIDIETEDQLESNNFQMSATLATAGLLVSQKLNEKSFVQAYGNLMFSDGFLNVNKKDFQQLKNFYSNDVGSNFHATISKTLSCNFYNYLVSESSNVLLNLFTWQDHARAKTLRDFSILNIKYLKGNNYITLNAGNNFSRSNFTFGNMSSATHQKQVCMSVNYKHLFSEKLLVQTGLSNEHNRFSFRDDLPTYYCALSPVAPYYHSDTSMTNALPEVYFYVRWKPFKNVIWGFGCRKNLEIFKINNPNYLSLQTNIRYNFLSIHSLLFSVGKYNNYSEPGYSNKAFRLLSSSQFSIEYQFETKNTTINLAAYYKNEEGDLSGNNKIKGFEIYLERYVFHKLQVSLSNTFLNAEINNSNLVYNADNNVGYFLRTTLNYSNVKLLNAAISWLYRQGKFYTPITSSIYNSTIDFYQPVYSDNTNSQRFGSYNTINLSCSRMFSIHKCAVIAFISIFNLLNTNNPQNLVFNKDYSSNSLTYYQKRSVYFGLVFTFK